MTFILGLKCIDGIVLCSEQLESGGYAQRHRDKLEVRMINDWGIAWGGSGPGDIVDKFSDKLWTILKTANDHTIAKIELYIESCLKFINDQYAENYGIAIVASIFGRDPLDYGQGIIAPGFHEAKLYRGYSSTSCLAPEHEYAIAGMDVTLAQFVLRNTFNRLMSLDQGVRLAVFITALMKEYAEGVGGPIEVVTHARQSAQWKVYDPGEIAAIEAEFPLGEIQWMTTKYWWDKNPVPDKSFMDNLRQQIAARKKKGSQ